MDWGDNDAVISAPPASAVPSWGENDKPAAQQTLIPTQTERFRVDNSAGNIPMAPLATAMGAGLDAGLANAVKVVPMSAGGLMSLVGAPTQVQDVPFAAVKAMSDYADRMQTAGQQISPGATTAGNVLSFLPQLAGGEAALPETAETAVAENAPHVMQVLANLKRGVPMAAAFGTEAANQNASGVIDQGGSVADAEKLYGTSLAANTAANLIPAGASGNLLTRALVGGAANAAGGTGAQELEHLNAPAYVPAPTLSSIAQQGGIGAAMSAVLGHGAGGGEVHTPEFGANDPIAPDLGHPQQAPVPETVPVPDQAAQDAAQASTAHTGSGATAAGLVAKNAAEAGLSPTDTAAHVAAAQAMVKADPNAEAPLHPATPIDATHSIPLGGGGSTDNSVNFIDKRIPKFVDVPNDAGDMVRVDAHDVIANAHEAPEKTQLDQGKVYADAHNVNANTYEEAYLREKYGVSHEAFNKVLEPYLAQAEEQGAGASDIPAKLDPKPYVDSGTEHLLQPKSDADITQALHDTLSDMPTATKAYSDIPETKGGTVLSTDVARELSPDYMADRTRAAATHEPASAFIKRLYAEKLAGPTPEGMDRSVLITGGGTGAGKTTGLEALEGASGNPEITYDTNMNKFVSADKKIQQALEAGRHVHIAYTYRDPVESLTDGAIKRSDRQEKEFGTGRTVPLTEHAATHVGSRQVIEQLSEKYRDNPNVDIHIIDNSRGRGNMRAVDLADIPSVEHNGLHERLQSALDTEHQAGRISDAGYEGFAGHAPQAGHTGVREAGERGSPAPQPAAESAQEVTPAAVEALRSEIGWDQVGGRIVREPDEGGEKPEVIGRTTWVSKTGPNEETGFWVNRPSKGGKITEAQARAALDKFAAGEPLNTREQRFIDYAKQEAKTRDDAYDAQLREFHAQQEEASPSVAAAASRWLDDQYVAPPDREYASTIVQLVDRAYDAGVDPQAIREAFWEGTDASARRLHDITQQKVEENAQTNEVQGSSEGGAGSSVARPAAAVRGVQEEVSAADSNTAGQAPTEGRPAEPEAAQDPVDHTTSIKNEQVNAERARKAKDALETTQRLSDADAHTEASQRLKDDPGAGEKLAQDLINNPRAPSKVEDMVLALDRQRIETELRESTQQISDAIDKGDKDAETFARMRQAAADSASELNDLASHAAGTESGRSLQGRKAAIAEDYSLGNLLNRAKAAKGSKLSDAERAMIEDHTKRIADLEAKLAARDVPRGRRKPVALGDKNAAMDEFHRIADGLRKKTAENPRGHCLI